MLLLCLFDIIKHVVLPWNVPLFCCCIVYIELLNSEPLELYILTSSVPVWNLRGVLEVLVPSAYAVAGLHAFCKAPLRTNIKLLSGKNSFTKSQITTKMHPVHNVSIKYIYKHRQKKGGFSLGGGKDQDQHSGQTISVRTTNIFMDIAMPDVIVLLMSLMCH